MLDYLGFNGVDFLEILGYERFLPVKRRSYSHIDARLAGDLGEIFVVQRG